MTGRNRIILATCETPPGPPTEDPMVADSLRRHGADTVMVPWSHYDPEMARPGDTVLLRSTWDYHLQPELFLAWLAGLERQGVPVINPPELVRATLDKSYLTQDRPFGYAVPVTVKLPPDADVISAWLRVRNWRRFVMKPPISASAHGTALLDTDDRTGLDAALAVTGGPVLIQEFLPEIGRGELSLIYFAGRLSHVVCKRPAANDFRVQEEFGGAYEPYEAVPHLRAQAGVCFSHLPQCPIYARVDGVVRNGTFLLMELELIEPQLFLALAPGAADRFAEAVLGHIAAIANAPSLWPNPGSAEAAPSGRGRRT